jgi:hypothetical protein
MADQIEPRRIGQIYIDQRQVWIACLEVADSVTDAVGNEHVEAIGGEMVGEEGARGIVFFD